MKIHRNLFPLSLLLFANVCYGEDEDPQDILVCGPRCVLHVLQHYGRDMQLHEIIDDIEKPIFQGTTLSDLSDSLTRHGVQNQIVQVSPDAIVEWGHPVFFIFLHQQKV